MGNSMKTWKFIQRVVVVLAMITFVSIADNSSITAKEAWTALVILAMVVIYVIRDFQIAGKKEVK